MAHQDAALLLEKDPTLETPRGLAVRLLRPPVRARRRDPHLAGRLNPGNRARARACKPP